MHLIIRCLPTLPEQLGTCLAALVILQRCSRGFTTRLKVSKRVTVCPFLLLPSAWATLCVFQCAMLSPVSPLSVLALPPPALVLHLSAQT